MCACVRVCFYRPYRAYRHVCVCVCVTVFAQVVQVPTNKPKRRVDLSSRFYFDPDQRTAELCRIVENCWMRGRCVCVCCVCVCVISVRVCVCVCVCVCVISVHDSAEVCVNL